MYEGSQTVAAPTADAPYIRMLSETAEAANKKAQEEGFGSVKHEIVQFKPTLMGVEVQFISEDDNDDGEVYRLFAAGTHRGHSMVKVQKVDPEGKYIFISKSGSALLSLLAF